MYSLNAICKATGKRWRAGGKFKSDAAEFLTHLTIPLNNTAAPSGSVETFPSDHGVEILSNHIRRWLKLHGVFHLTAVRHEPNYNAVIERSSVKENMAFTMLHYARKSRSWWDYAFDWAVYMLDRCPRQSNVHGITPFEALFEVKPDLKNIKVFGCFCCTLVHPEDHLYSEQQAQHGVFVGIGTKFFDGARNTISLIPNGTH